MSNQNTIPFKLYNTESREIELIFPRDQQCIRMYTCGPTVYNFAHIGNFRTYVFEDLLRRTLKFFNYPVMQAMNITDVDDKTIQGAIAHHCALKEFTDPYRIAFFEDIKTLNIEEVEFYPAATDYILEMIHLIEKLLENGSAYRSSDGGIYFKISSFPSYGRLSHLRLDELKINASGENPVDEYDKENISDFALWKAYDPERDGAIFWESPFGRGRPGWHIECSAMAMKLLGDEIDIHCGGVDNMFPHHENEIAQTEAVSHRQFVRHWVHVEHLLVNHKKMSKSLHNFYTLRDLLNKGYSGRQIRYLLLSTHYRTQLNFTIESLEGAKAALQRMDDLIVRLNEIQLPGLNKDAKQLLQVADEKFSHGLAFDMNISSALAAIFDLIRELNILIDAKNLTRLDAQEVLSFFKRWDAVLGVVFVEKSEHISQHVLDLLERRNEARKKKNFILSDSLRDEIDKNGYIIEDTPSGSRLKKK